MSHNWKKYRLGDLLKRERHSIQLNPNTEYSEVTVRLWGKGVNLRGKKLGSEIGSSNRYRVKSGYFIFSKIDARHGAFGIVPPDLDGAIVTADFPVYSANQNLVDIQFLYWLSKTPSFIDACKSASKGTTNRVRLKESKFENISVYLPSVLQQKEIVCKIDDIYEKYSLLSSHRESVTDQIKALLSSEFHEILKESTWAKMKDVCPIVKREVEHHINKEYPEIGVRSFGNGTFHKPTLMGSDIESKRLFKVKNGDLLFSQMFSWEGAVAVPSGNDDERIVSNYFITCRADENHTNSEFLCHYFLTPEGLEKLSEASSKWGGRNRPLSTKKLEEIEVPLPGLKKLDYFIELKNKAKKIQDLQDESTLSIEALMPSILDKAFKGELV